MKQKLAAIALLLGAFAFVQSRMPAIDPSGIICCRQAEQQNHASLKTSGLLADPSGTATVKANAVAKKP